MTLSLIQFVALHNIASQDKTQLYSAGFHGILAVLEAIGPTGPNIPNVLSNLKSGFGALAGTTDDAPGNRAWVWAFKTLSCAASEVLRAERIKAPLSAKKDEAVQQFLSAAVQFDGAELESLTLLNPSLSTLFNKARAALGPMILKATTGMDLEVTTLDERFSRALRTGSNRTLCEDPEYFRTLEDGLTGLAGESARRDGHWARHAHWISHQFTDAPTFSPDEDEIIPLESVYLPSRCFWHDTIKIEDEDGEEKWQTYAHVADLHKTAVDWLSCDAQHDPLCVVTGGPGSGKSSFARAFAHEVIQGGTFRVLFIQLQHMTLSGSLHDDIVRYVDRRDTATGKHGSPGIAGNPFDWRKTDEKPVLMIFDGLDELSTKEEDGERNARELLLALKLLLSPLNADGTPIRAMVLGRNLACQGAMETANIPLNTMLNIAPIAEMTSATCSMSSKNVKEVKDPDSLMALDQRAEYWRKWATLKWFDRLC
ncbi:NACHT domain-containing protein [Sulfitobacter brevis]|uniref:NACHT domain-containing protein n=1 Tax=Sulfitobacter brevis TaxID=74348 RepID=A0A1I2HQF8_9RHOB|nr:NACHT domain-containing protein [Sulfitobacter brevis]SFF31057.1 NACHT domain-containing protein [Sulfitobacter brevis]